MIFTVIYYLGQDRRKISPLVVYLNTNCINVFKTWKPGGHGKSHKKPGKWYFWGGKQRLKPGKWTFSLN